MLESSSSWRLFIGISAEAEVLDWVSRLRAECGIRRGVRWTPAEQVHLTLKFLGEVETSRVDGIRDSLARVSNTYLPFVLELAGAGAFRGRDGTGVLWIGVAAHEELFRLAADLDRALARHGFASERRPYRPHLTVARWRSGAQDEADRVLSWAETIGAARLGWSVRGFTLFRSELGPAGARYTRIGEFPLGGAPPNGFLTVG